MHPTTAALGSLLLLALSPILPGQVSRTVPSTAWPTIQSAIDASVDGDTVLVLPGRYLENLQVTDLDITIRGTGGAAATTIDGGLTGPVITFADDVNRQCLLQGFTITRGASTGNGGGIRLQTTYPPSIYHGPSPTIRECSILGNTATGYGGGLGGTYGEPLVERCLIEGNSADKGGGIGLEGSSIFVGTPLVRECTIRSNTALTGGGGLCLSTLQVALIQNNTITGNISQGTTGAFDGGGGILAGPDTPLVIRNNLIHRNRSGSDGGGIKFFDTGLTLVNNTIVDNQGGGVAGHAGGSRPNVYVSMANTILWNNGPTPVSLTGLDLNGRPPSASIDWCDVQGGAPGTGNIDQDPLLLNPASGNLRLNSSSPCRDSGNASATSLPTTDFEGRPRIIGASVDMGAFEYDGTLVYFHADRGTLSVATGGQVTFRIIGRIPEGGFIYLIMPSFSGTDPGLHLGPVQLPLNPDYTTWPLLATFRATLLGNLGYATSQATTTLALPAALPTSLVGLTMSTATLIIDPTTMALTGGSNPENLHFVP